MPHLSDAEVRERRSARPHWSWNTPRRTSAPEQTAGPQLPDTASDPLQQVLAEETYGLGCSGWWVGGLLVSAAIWFAVMVCLFVWLS